MRLHYFNIQLFDAKKTVLIVLSVEILLFAIFGSFRDIAYHRPIVAFLLVAFLFFVVTSPLMFTKQIVAFFSTKINISFNNDSFTLTKYIKNTIKSAEIFSCEEIVSYRFYFTKPGITHLVLCFKNGKNKDFGFRDNKSKDDVIDDENSSLRMFTYFINKYNSSNSGHTITLRKGFLNTRGGTIFIYCFGVLFLAAFIFHIIVSPHSSFVLLLVALSSLFQVFAYKKQDNDCYDKIKSLE